MIVIKNHTESRGGAAELVSEIQDLHFQSLYRNEDAGILLEPNLESRLGLVVCGIEQRQLATSKTRRIAVTEGHTPVYGTTHLRVT